ncbi:hypothetical protein [uncultured Psychroserpens sp.]|uniref:tetratricopeptide repeat protein n=1 Tax=uncultured Psychroserpens sp. TaxID=255436 RepID=UPI002637AC20|nr:hypothetical protein [uncultured Psychroserpens sp.]
MSTETKKQKKWVKTLKILAAYLVAAWTFLQFVDWILNRYNISPYWVDVLLWVFIGIIPSLAIYLYHQDRINKRILKLREKIIFPLNIVLLIITLYFGFGNSDLGATTKNITYENDLGEVETKTITKEEFRIGIPIYTFEQIDNDSTISWMHYGIGKLLHEDLLQNKSLSPDFLYVTTTTSKIREASLFYDFYVDGTFKKNGDDFEITTSIRKSSNGKTLKEQTFKGPNFLELLDDISVFITAQAGFVERNSIRYIDLPLNEFMSSSMPAIEAFANDDYSKAYSIDNTFALAYLENAKRSTLYNRGKLETQDIIDKAYALRNKLPLQKQLEVYIQRNLAYENYDEAEKLVKLQLEVDPNNYFYNQILFSIYGETRQVDAYFKKSEQLFDKDPGPEEGMNLAGAALVSGEDELLIDAIETYEVINPNLSYVKLQPLLLKGDIKAAETLLEDIKLQYPGNSNRSQVYDTVVNYLKNNSPTIKDLQKFVGTYRSGSNEQIMELWIEGDRLIQYIKNQRMTTFIPAGPKSIASGFIRNQTYKCDLVKNSAGKTYALSVSQFNRLNTYTTLYWKMDSSIELANQAYEKGNMVEAEQLYSVAFKNNPEHSYLANILKHLNYIKTKSTDSLNAQNKAYSGNYGPRKFWLEDGKFYYKRKGDNVDLPKAELLPISEKSYMYLNRLGTIMTFESANKTKIASVPYSYDINTKDWKRLDDDTNYFIKE